MSLARIPIRPPAQWSAPWFERFVYETLAPLVDGGSSSGADVQDLLDAGLVTMGDEALENARALAGQAGVIQIVDHGTSVEIKLEQRGVRLAYLQQVEGPAVLGVPAAAEQDVEPITAAANDTLLRRVADTLEFGALTAGMFPDTICAALGTAEIDLTATLFDLHGALTVSGTVATADQFVLPSYATASRPTPAGVGAMVFDTDLGIPIWHDGTNWIDAAGNTV